LISTFSLLFVYCLPQFCISLMPSILCSPCLHRIFWWVCQKCSNHTVSSSRRVWLEQNHVPSPIDSMFWFSTRRTEKEMKFRHRMKWCLLSWIKRYYSGVLLPRFGKTCWNNDVENKGLCCYLFPPNKLAVSSAHESDGPMFWSENSRLGGIWKQVLRILFFAALRSREVWRTFHDPKRCNSKLTRSQ